MWILESNVLSIYEFSFIGPHGILPLKVIIRQSGDKVMVDIEPIKQTVVSYIYSTFVPNTLPNHGKTKMLRIVCGDIFMILLL